MALTQPSPETIATNRFVPAASWAAVAAWMGVIFYMSSKTGVTVWSPMTYVAHFTEYLILGALLCTALRTSTPLSLKAALGMALVIASLYGVSDEIHQAFVPTRQPDALDWVIDTLGASVSCGLWALAVWGRPRRRA